MKDTDFCSDLKKTGLKTTKHRTEILKILEQSNQPIAAEQVFLELKKRNISVNISTVYRTLESLTEKSLIIKLNISEDNKTLFDINRMVHRHYLVCLGCKKIQAIDYCPLENYEKSLEEQTNFSITGHKLNIYGYCPECKQKNLKKK